MDAAIADARIAAGTASTIAELMGPVDMKMSTSAAASAGQYTAWSADDSATYARGAASSVVTPDTIRFALGIRRCSASASQPPANVPAKPVATSTAPSVTDALWLLRWRSRTRNVGIHAAMPPVANVYAA